jgi:hypothetical protein
MFMKMRHNLSHILLGTGAKPNRYAEVHPIRSCVPCALNFCESEDESSRTCPMKTKTHFAFRVDIWDDTSNSIVEHVAGVDDFEVAEAAYRAAVARWPAARITLRQGARIA